MEPAPPYVTTPTDNRPVVLRPGAPILPPMPIAERLLWETFRRALLMAVKGIDTYLQLHGN